MKVDEETGKVEILDYVAAHDVGLGPSTRCCWMARSMAGC